MSKLISRFITFIEFVFNRIRSRPKSNDKQGLLGMYFAESNARRNRMNRDRQ
jgi:hypothetical protein